MFIEFLNKVRKFVYADGDGYRCQITPSRTTDSGNYTYNAVYAVSGEIYDVLRQALPTLPEFPWDIVDEKMAGIVNAICSPAPDVRTNPYSNESPFGICTFEIADSPLKGQYVSTDFAIAVEELYKLLGKPTPESFPRCKLATVEFKATVVSNRDRSRDRSTSLANLFGAIPASSTPPPPFTLTQTEWDDISDADLKVKLTAAGITNFAATSTKSQLKTLVTII